MRWLLTLLGILAISSSLWTWQQKMWTQQHLLIPDIDITATDSQFTRYDKNGAINLNIDAARLQHNRTEKKLYLTKPSMRLYQSKQDYWHVTAQTASSDKHYSRLYLAGGVKIEHHQNNKTILTLTTQHITLVPGHTAETDAAIKLVQHNNTLTATGAHIDLKTGKATLKKNIHVHYVPE